MFCPLCCSWLFTFMKDQRGLCLAIRLLCRTVTDSHREDQSEVSQVLAYFLTLISNVCLMDSGGSIALTHPLGMSKPSSVFCTSTALTLRLAGVRQVVTGLAELRRRDAKLLCTSMCIGSGMGGAAIFVNEARP